MEPTRNDSLYVDIVSPFELARYRPPADSSLNDHRYIGDGGITNGSSYNVFITPGGKFSRRPPTYNIFGTGAGTMIPNCRIDRMWFHSTLPNASGVIDQYYLASVFSHTTSLWEMWYLKNPGSWTQFTNTRNCNDSTQPHWAISFNGLAYIKGFPDASGDKLGTIIFDASSGTPAYKWWGALGPDTPVRLTGWIGKLTADISESATSITISSVTAPSTTAGVTLQIGLEFITGTFSGAGPYTFTVSARGVNGTRAVKHTKNDLAFLRVGTGVTSGSAADWDASDHNVDVYVGWRYGIAYETNTRHVTNVSPFETNPDLLPSSTGPFADLIPRMIAPTVSDTTNVPYLWMFRSQDGSKILNKLERIANPGGTSFEYEDDSLLSGASSTTQGDPLPDAQVDTKAIGEREVNSPPPTVNDPLVLGTDTPSPNVSKIVVFARRAWYFIDNMLWYSGEEEIRYGNTLESWPSGVIRANKIPFPSTGIGLEATRSALYAMTLDGGVYIITGTDRDSFQPRQISDKYPMLAGNYAASVSFLDRVAFVTSGYQVVVITGEDIDPISEPIIGLTSAETATMVQMFFFMDRERQWLMAHFPNSASGGGHSATWIYDWRRSQLERRDFWFPVWYSRISTFLTDVSNQLLVASMYDNASATKTSGTAIVGFNNAGGSGQGDAVVVNSAWTTEDFDWRAVLGPIKNPAGNHVNVAALPGLSTIPSAFAVEYNDYSSGGVLGVGVCRDTSSLTDTETLTGIDPTHRTAPTGYKSKEYWMNTIARDFWITLSRGTVPIDSSLEIYRIVSVTTPEAGIVG